MNDFDITKKMLKTINETKSNNGNFRLLTEDYETSNTEKFSKNGKSENSEGIPVTDDPKFGNQTLTTQKEAAKEIGADFKNFDTPLIFYPEDGDLVSSGQGCYIWAEGLQLTDDNVKKINKIQGFYKNWKDDITENPLF